MILTRLNVKVNAVINKIQSHNIHDNSFLHNPTFTSMVAIR